MEVLVSSRWASTVSFHWDFNGSVHSPQASTIICFYAFIFHWLQLLWVLSYVVIDCAAASHIKTQNMFRPVSLRYVTCMLQLSLSLISGPHFHFAPLCFGPYVSYAALQLSLALIGGGWTYYCSRGWSATPGAVRSRNWRTVSPSSLRYRWVWFLRLLLITYRPCRCPTKMVRWLTALLPLDGQPSWTAVKGIRQGQLSKNPPH